MPTTQPLYINANGRIACPQHGGQYLADALANRPGAEHIVTPLDDWIRYQPLQEAQRAEYGCEDCTFTHLERRHRPIVAIGWDGRSHTMYAYADQIGLPRHQQEQVPADHPDRQPTR